MSYRKVKLVRDIQSLSTFKRETTRFVKQMKKTKEPIVLTVNGKAQLVVQDADSYQALLEAKERMDAIAGIKRGLEAMQSAKGESADKFFTDFFAKHNIADE
jgi:prevent-host-death family protein